MPVEHVTVDVTATLRECFGERIELIKDLQPDQRICTTCKGLALVKRSQPFALVESSAARTGHGFHGFPYSLEYVCFCPDCYTGVQTLCKHCGEPVFTRGYQQCNCKAAQEERRAASDAKEFERRKACRRVPLSDYDGDMVYDTDTSEFWCIDGSDDLDPEHTYFACKPGKDWVEPDADQVLEALSEHAAEICEDCEINYKPGYKEALEKALGKWFAKYSVLGTIYWPDYNTIVIVPEECIEEDDDDQDPSAVVTTEADGTEGIE